MLTREENELLCRVGRGTPMGEFMRQFWIPVEFSSELPGPDCDPLRVRLLGEDLVAFRDTAGRVGLLLELCPHRCASLFFGRNEEHGLRCAYHGWKFDVEGRCVDMPSEPPGSILKEGLRQRAYPCREAGGLIWTYMGPRKEPPPLPELEWLAVPDEHRVLGHFLGYANWVQCMEGDIDTTHLYHLHTRLHEKDPSQYGVFYGQHAWASLEVVETDPGVMYAARRSESETTDYCRITQFMFPFFSVFPASGDGTVPGHIWVPLDDEHTLRWSVSWNPVSPLSAEQRRRAPNGGGGELLPNTDHPLGRWRPIRNLENSFLQDREIQRTKSFCGIVPVQPQDCAMQLSMGSIVDRTQEHLGTSDAMIMQVRRRLIDAARALRERQVTPPCVDNPEWYRVRSATATLPKGASWLEPLDDWLHARTDCVPELDTAVGRRAQLRGEDLGKR